MRIIVTGSSGFLGSSLVYQFLTQGMEVGALVRPESIRIKGVNNFFLYNRSLSECESEISKWRPDIFYHLAWCGTNYLARNDKVNNKLNLDLAIESVILAAKAGCKQWIGAGSQAEYGCPNKEVDETAPLLPLSEYGKTKKLILEETQLFCEKNNLNHTWARVFSVYGPLDHPGTFISYLVKNMIQHRNLEVSSCNQIWDYLYINDAAEALNSLIGQSGIFNLASGKVVVLKQVILFLKQILSYRGEIKWSQLPDGPLQYLHGNIGKIKSATGWSPKVSVEEGLNKTVKYYQLKN